MSRLEWVLSGLLAILLIVLAVIGVLWWRQMQLMNEPLTIENGLSDGRRLHTAQSAYQLALPVAREWANDAQLLEASATWPPGQEIEPRGANWSFTFYAPASQQMALITVANSRANLFGRRAADSDYQPVAVQSWRVDSPELIETLMAADGRQFIERHGATILRLKLSLHPTPLWQAELIARETTGKLIIWLDADTGQLLYQEES
jgi:hypothetical protein